MASRSAATAVGSSPASRSLMRPNEKAQMSEAPRSRIIRVLATARARSHPEDRAEAPSEQHAGSGDHHPQEDHGPDPEGAREELAVAQELEELEDGLGYGEEG